MREVMKEIGPDLTKDDLYEFAGNDYEPSREAVEVATAMLDELRQWNGFDRWLENLGSHQQDLETGLQKVFDDWNEAR